MRNIIVIAVVLAAGACGKKDKFERVASDTEGFRDKMCACKDKGDDAAKKECADGVKKEIAAWEEEMEKEFKGEKEEKGKKEKPPKELMERMKNAHKEARECEKALGGGGGGDSDRIVEAMTNDVCACKDMKCVSDVQKKYMEQAKGMDMGSKPSTKSMENMKKMSECVQKLGAAPAPTGTADKPAEKKEAGSGGW